MNLRRWLTPGIGVKRWLVVLFAGLLLLALGVAHLIRQASRDLEPTGLAQSLIDAITLQFLPYPLRGLLAGVAAERPATRRRWVAGAAGEAVLEQLAHQWLGVSECGDAAPNVANGRDPELLAQDAGRTAVVGDRYDGGQVARVLLEPAQQRREPGSAADRDDPWTLGQEPLLIDEFHEGLMANANPLERVRQRADRPVGPKTDQGDTEQGGDQPAERERQELQGERIDDQAGRPAGLDVSAAITASRTSGTR